MLRTSFMDKLRNFFRRQKMTQTPKYKIVQYKHAVLRGKDCYIEEGFIPAMDRLCFYAAQSGILIYITSSYRKSTKGFKSIVEPAKMGNHLIGHGIDCNFIVDGVFWNSGKMEEAMESSSLHPKIKDFIRLIRNDESLRWGGDFFKTDVVHFDDTTNRKNPELWKEIYSSLSAAA